MPKVRESTLSQATSVVCLRYGEGWHCQGGQLGQSTQMDVRSAQHYT